MRHFYKLLPFKMQSYLKVAVTSFLNHRSFIRFAQISAVLKVSSEVVQHNPFEEHQVTIKTCGSLYERWRKEKKFHKVPDGDLTFNISYLDTGKGLENEDSRPVVLALHGAPGSYKDYDRTTTVLLKHGARVIAPNFPDYTVYKPGIFRHSVDEKVLYIKDFLKAINVSHIDLLICHSSATYPSLRLCLEDEAPTILGLALFNPGAFLTSMRGLQPWFFVRTMVYISEFPIGLKLMKLVGPLALRLVNAKVDLSNYLNPVLSATAMFYGGIVQSRELYRKLGKRKFPILMAFSENDKLINKELSYKVAYELGLQDPQIFRYDEKSVLVKEGRVHNNIKVLAFEKGSHYVLSKHSEMLNEEILKFLHQYVL